VLSYSLLQHLIFFLGPVTLEQTLVAEGRFLVFSGSSFVEVGIYKLLFHQNLLSESTFLMALLLKFFLRVNIIILVHK
jgi:hypothetical protein